MILKKKPVQTCDIDWHKVHETLIKLIPMLHCNKMYLIIYKSITLIRRNPMFDFTKQTKQYEELAQRIREVNEFWINSVLSSFKQFTKTK